MDGQRKRRYGGKEIKCRLRQDSGSGVGQKQMETSSSRLVIIMTEESGREKRERVIIVVFLLFVISVLTRTINCCSVTKHP